MTKARDLANASTALSAVSATELGYLDGVTSAVQTQMDAKLASSTAATTYVANSLADAKGDLFVATADNTVTRLPVGANGDTIVADSSTATGLRYQGNFAAGKNKIINGDFGIWQRGTTFTNVASGTFIADRFAIPSKSGTHTTTVTQQTFTPGTAPVSGYEGQYFLQMATSGYSSGDYYFGQKIEDVRTFAGQTVTYSYWARVTSGTFTPARVFLNQQFGSGGSAEVDSIGLSTPTYTTTWTRFTQTVAVPSIAGKTIGTGSNLWLLFQMVPSGNPTIQIWGVQVEASNTATAFQTATGTIQGELAACQRYYFRANYDASTNYVFGGNGGGNSTTQARTSVWFPVMMRTKPTVFDYATISKYAIFTYADGQVAPTAVSMDTNLTNSNVAYLAWTASSGLTANALYYVRGNNDSSAYLGFGAEL